MQKVPFSIVKYQASIPRKNKAYQPNKSRNRRLKFYCAFPPQHVHAAVELPVTTFWILIRVGFSITLSPFTSLFYGIGRKRYLANPQTIISDFNIIV